MKKKNGQGFLGESYSRPNGDTVSRRKELVLSLPNTFAFP